VTWMSAVFHHLVDLRACARELGRVTNDDGIVLIRGLLADVQVPPGLRFCPGWQRVVQRFPTRAELDSTLSLAGFQLLEHVEVADQAPSNVGELIDRVHRLRHADSLLAPLTDREIDAGLATLESHDRTEALDTATLSLLAFGRTRQQGVDVALSVVGEDGE